jgi:hypothetical protein
VPLFAERVCKLVAKTFIVFGEALVPFERDV